MHHLGINMSNKPLTQSTKATVSLQEITNTIGDGVYVIDKYGTITFINPKACKLLGFDEGEVYGKDSHSLFHHHKPDGSIYESHDCEIYKATSSGGFYESDSEVFWKKDATPLFISVNSSPIIRENNIVGSVISFRDNSKQRELETNLKDAVQRELQKRLAQDEAYKLLFESTPIGIGVVDVSGKVIDSNPAFCQMTGYTPEEILKKTIIDLTHPEDMASERVYHHMMNDGQINSFKIEKRLTGKNGKIIEIRLTVSAIRGSNGSIIKTYGFAEDMTEENSLKRKHIEQEKTLIRQEKMAMMGEMVGAIAHQWRQPLSAIAGSVQLLQMDHSFGDVNEQYINDFTDKTMNLVMQMNTTINDFRNFFKADKEKADFEIANTVRSVINLLSSQIKERNIFVTFNKPSEEIIVNGFENEMKQALLNIISNAKDALAEKSIPNPKIDIVITKRDDKAVVSIRDNAGGIDENIIGRIFEPYFSTKGDNGTGIGLSICKSIIEQNMHGKLSAKNIDGGAEFTIVV